MTRFRGNRLCLSLGKVTQWRACDLCQLSCPNRISELQAHMSDQSRRKEEIMRQVEQVQREVRSFQTGEKDRMQHAMHDVHDGVEKNLTVKEARLRDEVHSRITRTEKVGLFHVADGSKTVLVLSALPG